MPSFLDQPHLLAFLTSVIRLSVWLFLLALVFLPIERFFAVHPRKMLTAGFAGDVGFYFVSGILPALLLAPALALVAQVAHDVVPYRLHAAIAAWPLWARAAAGLIVSEIGFYWGHRWTHAIPLLWRFHSIHHNPTEVYFLVSARAHPVDNVFTRLCGLIPVYILGIVTPLTPAGGAVSAILVLVFTLWGFLIHANVRWRLGPLEGLVATPAFHHWHHTLHDHRDHNFAPMLPLVDRLFGTYYLPRHEWPSAYGIDTPLPRSVAGQLLHPFRPPPHDAAAVAADR